MKCRDFNTWLSSFCSCISDYSYYVDFPKIYNEVNNVKVELNILNSLIGSKHIEEEFEQLIAKYPETLKCIPLLLAVRASEIRVLDYDVPFSSNVITYNFAHPHVELHSDANPTIGEPTVGDLAVGDPSTDTESVAQYKTFMRKTGLFDLLEHHIVNNLVDYVTGVETGLDSNARKNRGGHAMENLVEKFIKDAGFVKDETYFKEMYIHEITERWHVDTTTISKTGTTNKRFDFVVKTPTMVYAVETNFYNGCGSKLNETARSYKELAYETDPIDGLTFVWITDGKDAWTHARHNLEETFNVMEHIYNIKDLQNGIITEVFK